MTRSVRVSFGSAEPVAAAFGPRSLDSRGHNQRVAELCVGIGRQLGMARSDLDVLARSGLLHDIGKLGIPHAILDKHYSLDAGEWSLIKKHPELGLAILGHAGTLKRELLGVLYHHERMDGSGYPRGLVGGAIPIEARIVAVADTYDVLTSDRPYRKARSLVEARRVVGQESGAHLDPHVVAALFRVIDGEPMWRHGLRAASA
jgi:HD-GYP domain-containing protein (c-di-GMP phosphodiesterase class II)